MEFNIDDYRARLNSALGLPIESAPGSGLVDEPIRLAANTPKPRLINAPQSRIAPQAGVPQPAPADQRPKLENGPADMKDDDFDAKKLAKAKTVADVTASMKPAARSKYMDWWESQYGSINQKYNQLRKEIGGPLDKRRRASREEKFDLLLEFGLTLMRNSAIPSRDHSGDISLAASEAMMNHMGRRELEEPIRQSKLSQIEGMRAAELKGLGNYGEAIRSDSDMRRNEASIDESRARIEQGKIVDSEQGLYRLEGSELSRLEDPVSGRLLTGRKTAAGRSGAGGRDSRTANQKNIEDLVKRGVPEDLAVKIVYRQIQDPRKAAASLYTVLKQQYASDEEAREAATSMVSSLYGQGELERPRQPIVPDRTTSSTRSGLTENDDPLELR